MAKVGHLRQRAKGKHLWKLFPDILNNGSVNVERKVKNDIILVCKILNLYIFCKIIYIGIKLFKMYQCHTLQHAQVKVRTWCES